MAHAVFHTGTPRHPKVAVLSDGAFRLWFASICFAADHLTDGLIPKSFVPDLKRRVTPKEVAELTTLSVTGYSRPLWLEEGDSYRINDFLHWNDSREEVQAGRLLLRARVKRHRNKAGNAVCNGVTSPVTNSVGNGVKDVGNTEHRTQNTEQSVTPGREEAVWELWRSLNSQHRVDEFLPMSVTPVEYGQLRKITAKGRSDRWLRLVMEQFLTTDHEPIASKQRTLGYLLSWWAFIEGRLRDAGRRPEAA